MDAIARLVKPLRPWWMEITVGVFVIGIIAIFLLRRRSTEGFQAPPPGVDVATLCAKYILQRDSLADQKRGFEISGNATMVGPLEAGINDINKKLLQLGCAEKIKESTVATEMIASGTLPPPPSNVNEIISEVKPAVQKAIDAAPVPAT
jgi:hypothetical protein